MWRWIGLGAALLLVLAGIFVYGALRLALPRDDDRDVVAGLGAPVLVSFDGFGVPLIKAGSRADAFAALGYVTARDRLFQMDLMRRNTAGRLAEVFGRSLVAADVHSRALGFEHVAEAVSRACRNRNATCSRLTPLASTRPCAGHALGRSNSIFWDIAPSLGGPRTACLYGSASKTWFPMGSIRSA